MPLTEIMAALFRWIRRAPWILRRHKNGVQDRHRLDLGSIPARIEAEKLKITIGAPRRRRRR